jgi:hypothetical protein
MSDEAKTVGNHLVASDSAIQTFKSFLGFVLPSDQSQK